MYCPSCGSSVRANLTFCKQCGLRLKGGKSEGVTKANEASADSLIWAMVVVFAVGLGATIGLMAMMKQALDFDNGTILGFGSVSFLLMILLELAFVSMLIRRRKPVDQGYDFEVVREQPAELITPATARTLVEPATSVTEDATKSFQKSEAYRKTEA